MREMKDSGIEWIGEIPKDWERGCIKNILEVLTDYTANGSFADLAKNVHYLDNDGFARLVRLTDLRLDLSNDDGVYVGEKTYNYLAKSSLFGGEILVANVGAYAGLFCEMPPKEGRFTLGPNMFLLRTNKRMIQHYLFYLGQAKFVKEQLAQKAISSAQPKLNKTDLKTVFIAIPSIAEQQQIADYLDTKCSEIDATAEDIQKEISLLEEYKKSVITEAVTKGLNPDAEMKDSGIEWIGDINRKASLCRLKFFSYMKGRIGWQGLKSEDFIDNGPYCVTGTDFINGKINWDTCYHVSEERYKMDSNIQLKIGDLLVTKDGTIGKLAKVTELPEKACLNSHLLIIRPLNERFTNEYLYYVISSDVFVRYYKYSSTGSTMESLSQEKLGNFIFPVYDLLSQQQIVDYLDSKCSEIETLIADKKRQLDILADYKKYLIYEYVTGKKEVPVKDF